MIKIPYCLVCSMKQPDVLPAQCCRIRRWLVSRGMWPHQLSWCGGPKMMAPKEKRLCCWHLMAVWSHTESESPHVHCGTTYVRNSHILKLNINIGTSTKGQNTYRQCASPWWIILSIWAIRWNRQMNRQQTYALYLLFAYSEHNTPYRYTNVAYLLTCLSVIQALGHKSLYHWVRYAC